jgi:hypothetical protein
MSQLLRSAHFAFAGIWLGCIVTELIVERAFRSSGDDFRVQASQLNWSVSALVEVPAFVGLLVTGAYILAMPHGVGLAFQVMLTAGLLTIFLGVFKVWLIFKRRSAALRSKWSVHEKLGHFQGMLSFLVLLGVLASIIAGAVAKGSA